ncbi:MAG: DNA polymerase III subunit delta [Bacteroidetes bacterium RIFOXYA12_FULL_35_11]|nr:MAG: DNA polymerase III subunit delta [Bacteroidetes bacterium GWF2_35_48]OFY77741.1 MAG: DNA polymerase III subunit delta [Bacteroidetes bacterium RIFOXYA12_FULL_35_11]OFY98407.1 MAG: DNA polymerase III subunit delta [Bacteroidetes bacterium RIFOXYC12_FULL_35_7]HBX51910.1 DNA polymerase III subunit delta [Bacteroidales bacterium]
MLFKEVIGQNEIKKRLIRSVNEGRISHAQLFIGPVGTGKLSLAIAYAQYISCENKQESDSCGECPSCHKYNKLIHPDLHFVFPVIKSGSDKGLSDVFIDKWREAILENPYISPSEWYKKIGAEKKQAIIYSEESENIIHKLNFKTFESEYKIMIIWLAEKMNVQGANKLLKIIEEPPPKTIFILISEEPDQLLQTILSRTQLIKLPRIDDESLMAKLKSDFSLSEEVAINIARISNGSYNDALNNFQSSEETIFNFEQFVSIMRASYGLKMTEIQKWVSDMAEIGRGRQKNFFIYALRMLRENYVQNLKVTNLNYMTKEEQEFSDRFSTFVHRGNIEDITKEINTAIFHIDRNGAARIIFTDLALKLHRLLRR